MNKHKISFFSTILLCFSIVFYLFFAFYDGVVICADSPSYIDMSISRECFYPILLAILRFLSAPYYLMIVVVLQSLLAAYCTFNVTIYLKRQFQLNTFITIIIFAIPCLVSLLNRFAAGRASMYSNSILTEGITISLFLLFFRYLLDYLINYTKKALIIASSLSFILISTRKQMYLTLFLLFIVILYIQTKKDKIILIKKKNALISTLSSLGICIVIFLGSFLLDHSYNYVLRGEFTGHSSDNRFLMTMIFYTSEREYSQALPEEMQSLFLSIYNKCEDNGYLMHSAGDGWYAQVEHFGDHYDNIQIDTMWPTIQSYAATHINSEYTGRELATDNVTHQMIKALLPATVGRILHVLWNNLLSGLVTTIAQRKVILIWYSLIAYFAYIVLLVNHIRTHHGLTAASLFGLLTLISILVNVLLVSSVIFCQTRYTIYNMPIFYISGLILLYNLINHYSSIERSMKQ